MDFDFNLILVPVTLILGAVWLLDKFVFHQRKQRGAGKENFLISWAYDFFPILAIVLIVRSFIIEPYNIPSSSMVPSLYTGDFIAVNKYAYGIRLPLTHTKILDSGRPQHGDVMVFRYPENPKINYIKRVVGLPGDTVSYQGGILSVNGKPITIKQVNYQADPKLIEQLYTPIKNIDKDSPQEWKLSPQEAKQQAQVEESLSKYYQEQLGGHTYLRRYLDPQIQFAQYSKFLNMEIAHANSWHVIVPEGNYFVMGDNSDRSEDGRFWGFVPDANVVGKAVYVWMHKQSGLTNLPTFSRNGAID